MMLFADTIVVALASVLVAWAAGLWMHRRRRGLLEARRSEYVAIIMQSLLAAGDEIPSFPQIRRSWARRILAEALASILTATCGLDMVVLYRIIVRYNIDSWLLRRIKCSSGYRRAGYLLLLGRLPIDAACAVHVVRRLRSRNPYVRLHALVAQLAGDPSSALRHIAEYPGQMTALEVAEVMALLRRGLLPVAWEPLLLSRDHNLRRVGLSIVRHFGVEEAESVLWRLLDDDAADSNISIEVLHTLCTLSHRLNFDALRPHFLALGHYPRRALLRLMATEGYAAAAVASLVEPAERPYYESLVESYKKVLPCP